MNQILKLIGVVLLWALLLSIVFTGGGVLSPEYWQIVLPK